MPKAYRQLRVRQFPVTSLLLALGTLITLGQFWYTMVYVPASAAPVSASTMRPCARPGS